MTINHPSDKTRWLTKSGNARLACCGCFSRRLRHMNRDAANPYHVCLDCGLEQVVPGSGYIAPTTEHGSLIGKPVEHISDGRVGVVTGDAEGSDGVKVRVKTSGFNGWIKIAKFFENWRVVGV